jgi:lysophospholipid acyltransferase (LPLAT)-like uncharacterized protein
MMGWLLRLAVMGIGRTLRWRVEDPARLLDNLPRQPVIFAVWHNRLFLVPYLHRRFWQRQQLAVMVSASKDGEKLVRVLEKFHLVCVRGSSSRRGKEALREMVSYVNAGYDAGITPDGPRGPKYQVAHGIVSLAQVTGAPIMPISWDVGCKITLKSWDGFMIPLPFARATLRIGAPLTLPRDAGETERENKRLELENVLKSLSNV